MPGHRTTSCAVPGRTGILRFSSSGAGKLQSRFCFFAWSRAVLKEPDFVLVKDRPQGPPSGTTNRRQPPAATNHQLPTTTNRHHPPITNHQPPPTATNRQLPTANRQRPPTAANLQLPTANRQPPPTANHQPPPTMVEHMECLPAFLGKLCHGTLFFFPLRTARGWFQDPTPPLEENSACG